MGWSSFLITSFLVLLLLSAAYCQSSEGDDESDQESSIIAAEVDDESEASAPPGWTESLTMRTKCDANNPAHMQECNYDCRISDGQIYGECSNGACHCYGQSSYACIDTFNKFGGIIYATAPWTILTSYDGPTCESYQDDMQCDLQCRQSANAFVGKCRQSQIWETRQCFCCGLVQP